MTEVFCLADCCKSGGYVADCSHKRLKAVTKNIMDTMVTRRQHPSMRSLPEHLAMPTAATHLAYSRLRQGDQQSHQMTDRQRNRGTQLAATTRCPRDSKMTTDHMLNMDHRYQLETIASNQIKWSIPADCCYKEAIPWMTSHRPGKSHGRTATMGTQAGSCHKYL